MPNLPTLTVTDEQLNALLNVFGNAQVYQSWLAQQIQAYAIPVLKRKLDAQAEDQLTALRVLLSTLGT